jgi:hypothetical protein
VTSSAEAPRARPLLAAAVLCERILTEKDNVHSVIRIVDTFTVVEVPKDSAEAKKPGVVVHAFIAFKSGAARGKYDVQLVLHRPSGEPDPLGEPNPMVLEGGVHGSTLQVTLHLGVTELGDYSIDVMVDGEVMTRMPFRLQLAPAAPTSPSTT